ncbi:MAG: phosphoribosylformylglycinamidine cyclo-ligase, partial [Alphaproteobacteria bacterium]|nr:phosphoribosylformylglycinamidine cyclo-ligase [Alphaproteobacteria bacterium]
QANIAEPEMLATFNCGVGLVAVADPKTADLIIAAFRNCGDRAFAVGSLANNGGGEPQVRFSGKLK